MDVDTESEFLVVDLEHCVPADIRSINKNNVYSTSLSPGNVQLTTTTVPNLGDDLNSSMLRIHSPLTQLQTVNYQQIHVNYEGSHTHGLSPLYQNSTLSNYSPTLAYSSPFLHSLSPVHDTSIPVPSTSSPTPPNPPTPPPLPPPPKDRRKQSSVDLNDVPHFPINDYEYYKEIEKLLVMGKYPERASESYTKHLKKRARHYLIIDNVLYHNPKKPKKVVMRKQDQIKLLEDTHIDLESGIHLGIKKMVDIIHAEYFWRGLYEDIASFVNNCPKCRDSVDLAQRREKELRRFQEDYSDDEIEHAYTSTAVQTCAVVWSKVEIQIHGPFKVTENRNEYVLTVTDPESCFVLAAPIPRKGCAVKISDFILKTFYTFGFPQPYFVSDKDLYEEVAKEYNDRLKQTAWKTELHWQENSGCLWVSQLAELLIVRKADRWDKEMDKFMFQFRAGCIRHSPTPKGSVPFYSMFQRLPYFDDKENKDARNRVRNDLQCAECDDVFTSRVALRLHKKQHIVEEARKTSLLEYAIEKNESREENEVDKSRIEVAMGEIKNYLAKTKDIRRKRGKYQKYSVDMQENMIAYAKKHGIRKASIYFSKLIGSNVSDSTIRNLLKSSVHFYPRTKEEIAHYAIEFGVDEASKHFSQVLNKEVPPSLVSKFKILYGGKFTKKDGEKLKESKREADINSLTDQEKEIIGNYACDHSIEETINFYFEKWNIKLNENDVKGFQEKFSKHQRLNFVELAGDGINIANITYQNLPAGSVCFSPSGSIVQIQDPNYSYHDVDYSTPVEPHENHELLQQQGSMKEQPVERVEECPVVDHFLLVSQESPPSCISSAQDVSQKSLEWSDQGYPAVPEDNHHSLQIEIPSASGVMNKNVETPLEDPSLRNDISKECKKNSKKKESGKKRGSYTIFSPELRARIGKYASEHGSLKASNHFSKILGHDLAESTARGLKERYLKKVKHCDVTSLGYNSRGRPLILGKYDEVVQECLKELVRSGERITSFLAITTAKQILNKLEPSLLQENGGTVVLNNTWAKSILKRIGVRNNS